MVMCFKVIKVDHLDVTCFAVISYARIIILVSYDDILSVQKADKRVARLVKQSTKAVRLLYAI